MTSRLPWTPAEIDHAAAMWRDGATADAIAAAIGKTAAAVALRLHRLRAAGGDASARTVITKWTPARDDRLLAMWGTDASVASIAEALGTTMHACRGRMDVLRPRCVWTPSRLRNPRRPWTEAEDAALLGLRASHRTAVAIGQTLGRTPFSVTWRFKTLRRRGVAVPVVSPGPRPRA